jgi:hypothetical protein
LVKRKERALRRYDVSLLNALQHTLFRRSSCPSVSEQCLTAPLCRVFQQTLAGLSQGAAVFQRLALSVFLNHPWGSPPWFTPAVLFLWALLRGFANKVCFPQLGFTPVTFSRLHFPGLVTSITSTPQALPHGHFLSVLERVSTSATSRYTNSGLPAPRAKVLSNQRVTR